jgi:hypothetical protein
VVIQVVDGEVNVGDTMFLVSSWVGKMSELELDSVRESYLTLKFKTGGYVTQNLDSELLKNHCYVDKKKAQMVLKLSK